MHPCAVPPMKSVIHEHVELTHSHHTHLRTHLHPPSKQVECGMCIGRCLAKLGREAEAMAAFDKAVAEAHRTKMYFHCMLAVRDRWVACPTAAPPLVELGRAIAAMEARQLDVYTVVLGHGLDAKAALTAYQRQV